MKLNAREIAVFAMLGALMYASKVIMDLLPNIHLLGVLTMSITLVFRKKALYPIYIFVLILGLINGFSTWWLPYLYLWTVLWGMTMLLPEKMPARIRPFVYMLICALHGFAFGLLYMPMQAIIFGLGPKAALAWWIAGFPFDAIHGVSNFFLGALIVPLSSVIRKCSVSILVRN